MTSETVYSQGSAVLEECAEENCVITLGSKIGADYIVRGTLSKLGSRFSLQVEMYETNDGTLVASCDPVRSESIKELIEKAAAACADMFKTWLAAQNAPDEKAAAKKAYKRSMGVGGYFANDGGGTFKIGGLWSAEVSPNSGLGGNYFWDGLSRSGFGAKYVECSLGFSTGNGIWMRGDKPPLDYYDETPPLSDTLATVSRLSINYGMMFKYPFDVRRFKLFPLVSWSLDMVILTFNVKDAAEKTDNTYRKTYLDVERFSYWNTSGATYYGVMPYAYNYWVQFGGGFDFNATERIFLRGVVMYGFGGALYISDPYYTATTYGSGTPPDAPDFGESPAIKIRGATIRLGAGFKY